MKECVCLLLQYLLQSCSRGGRGIVEDMGMFLFRVSFPEIFWKGYTNANVPNVGGWKVSFVGLGDFLRLASRFMHRKGQLSDDRMG